MRNHIIPMLLVLVSLFSNDVLAENQNKDVIWGCDKVSNTNFFGEKDINVINNLKNIYTKVTIDVGEKKVNVKNDFLEKINVCSIDYVKIEKTPLEYFLSKKTVDMYE